MKLVWISKFLTSLFDILNDKFNLKPFVHLVKYTVAYTRMLSRIRFSLDVLALNAYTMFKTSVESFYFNELKMKRLKNLI